VTVSEPGEAPNASAGVAASAAPGATTTGPPGAPRRLAGGRLRGALAGVRDFAGHVVRKADEDNIFFLAGAIAFNVIVAFVPLVFAAIGIAGTILRVRQADPTEVVLEYLSQAIPPVSPEFEQAIADLLSSIIAQSTGLLSVGTIFLVWVATRLIGTLRTVLSEIFDVRDRRGFIAGKLFDMKMVLAAGTLLALNVGLTAVAEVVARFGVGMLGIRPGGWTDPRVLYGTFAAFLSIWAMFLLIYRYLPAHRVPWRIAFIAASVTAVLFEIMKQAFSWYIANLASFTSMYGGYVATLIILIFWIYYSAVAFVLGGEVAQVAMLHRVRKRQRERLA